jgi:hypothetical protein
MNKKRELVLRITGAMMLPALWAAGADLAAAGPHPRAASATVTRTGPAGNTATRQSNVATNGQGGYTAGSTVTGPAGNTATRQQSGSYNPATKTYTRSGTTTGPNGNSSSFNTSVQATGSGLERSATRTGPNGNSVTSTGHASYNPATGTATQSRTTTGPNGKSATESRTVTVSPTPSN